MEGMEIGAGAAMKAIVRTVMSSSWPKPWASSGRCFRPGLAREMACVRSKPNSSPAGLRVFYDAIGDEEHGILPADSWTQSLENVMSGSAPSGNAPPSASSLPSMYGGRCPALASSALPLPSIRMARQVTVPSSLQPFIQQSQDSDRIRGEPECGADGANDQSGEHAGFKSLSCDISNDTINVLRSRGSGRTWKKSPPTSRAGW